MIDDTSVPEGKQLSIEVVLASLRSPIIGEQIWATNTLQRMAPDLARQVIALRAQVAAHEDADRRWSADMAALRDELRAERDFRAQMIADRDARSGEPL